MQTTHDIGAGWFATWTRPDDKGDLSGDTVEHLTIRSPKQGIRIDLDEPSALRLKAIFAATKEG